MSQKSGERSRTPGASCLFNFVYSIRSKSRISEKGEGGGGEGTVECIKVMSYPPTLICILVGVH